MDLKTFYKKYEHHINSSAFIGGYIFDNFALSRIDEILNHIILSAWLVISAAGIIVYSAVNSEVQKTEESNKFSERMTVYLPFIIQFALGAMLSGSLIFYSQSASLSVSWPFIFIILSLMIGNEIFRGRYSNLVFQLCAFFVATFLYSSFLVPIVLKDISTTTFLISGALSLLILFIVGALVGRFAKERFHQSKSFILSGVLGFYLLFNALYFTNLIPPLPLSLKEIGIYHGISKNPAGDYDLFYEPAPWYKFRAISDIFIFRQGQSAYAFSSIFAPTDIGLNIAHEWLYFDEDKDIWISNNRVVFPISGGRDEGYRGYSIKSNITEGKWRLIVSTESGHIIGRTDFVAKNNEASAPVLKSLKR